MVSFHTNFIKLFNVFSYKSLKLVGFMCVSHVKHTKTHQNHHFSHYLTTRMGPPHITNSCFCHLLTNWTIKAYQFSILPHQTTHCIIRPWLTTYERTIFKIKDIIFKRLIIDHVMFMKLGIRYLISWFAKKKWNWKKYYSKVNGFCRMSLFTYSVLVRARTCVSSY